MTDRRGTRSRKFVLSIEALLETLPTAEERGELQRGLEELIGFLMGIKDSLQRMPAADSEDLRGVVRQLAAFLDRAEQSETLGRLAGVRRGAPRTGASRAASISTPEAEALLAELKQLREDDVRARLRASSRAELRGVAVLLGMPDGRASREALANQVASKVLNARGYKLLRDGVSK